MTDLQGSKPECHCPEGYDQMYHCSKCDDCCFDWGTYKTSFQTYEEQGLCCQCAMNEGMTLEELVSIHG